MNSLGIPVGLVVEAYKVGSGIYNNIRKKEDEKFDNEYAKRKAEIESESVKVKVNGYDTNYNPGNNVYTVLTPEVVSFKRSLPNSRSGRSRKFDDDIKSQIREFLKPYQFYIDTYTKQVTPVYPEAAAKVWGIDENGNRVVTSTTTNSSSNKKKVNIIIIAVAAIAATYLILKD